MALNLAKPTFHQTAPTNKLKMLLSNRMRDDRATGEIAYILLRAWSNMHSDDSMRYLKYRTYAHTEFEDVISPQSLALYFLDIVGSTEEAQIDVR